MLTLTSPHCINQRQRDPATTPVAIIQLTKVVVYVFVFTIPLLLVGAAASDDDVVVMVATWSTLFVLTFMFLGLEFLAEELEDKAGAFQNHMNGFE